MKKKLLLALSLLGLVLALSACGSSGTETAPETESPAPVTETAAPETEAPETEAVETEAAVYEVPNGFTDGYVYGDYATYSDASTAESLKGDLVWFEGAITGFGTVELGDSYLGVCQVSDESGNCWLVIYGTTDAAIDDTYVDYNYEEYGVCMKGVYLGLSDNGTPTMIAHYSFAVSSGETDSYFPDYVYEAETPAETEAAEAAADGVSPEFKQTMDDYEAFFDQYVEFMNTYAESDDALSMMSDYLDFLTQYTEVMADLEAIDETTLSPADDAYYIEVMARIDQKLLGVVAAY